MLVAVNSKKRRYEPLKWVMDKRTARERVREAERRREPMTGEQILDRFRSLGVPIIDNRKNKGITDGRD
jgi:hypothetical protein